MLVSMSCPWLLSLVVSGFSCVSLADKFEGVTGRKPLAIEQATLQPLAVYLNRSLKNIPDQTRLRSLRLIVRAFAELGYAVEFAYQPSKRMIASVAQGEIGAICLRAAGMERSTASILRVPVSVHQLKLYGYVHSPAAPASGLWRDASIKSVGFSVGAQNSRGYIPHELLQKHFVRTRGSLAGARMARAGRLDMVILPEVFVHASERSEQALLSGLVRLQPEVGVIETYCFLNRAQQHLFEPLAAVLKRLKRQDPQQFDDSRYPMLLAD